MRLGKNLALFLLVPCALWSATIPYSVEIGGLEDGPILKEIRSTSQLFGLKKKPPSSINALRFRAESDIPELIKILNSHGYLEATIEMNLREGFNDHQVILQISPGPLYRIAQYFITLKNGEEEVQCKRLKLHDLGIIRSAPLETKTILESEVRALEILSECGYPLAQIQNREVIADGSTKEVQVFVTIEIGPLAHFGPTTIVGNTSVKNVLIENQIQWCENDPFNSCLVEGTELALMDTGLFTSVYITHPQEFDSNDLLPMKIELAEAKHKSICIGVSYQTTFGAGATFGWENHNVAGLGRTLSLQANIAQRSISGIATYLVPNFHCVGDRYTFEGQIAHESIKPYRMQSYGFYNGYERCVGDYFYYSVGAEAEYLKVSNSVDNGNFFLLELPIHLRWTNVEDFLNPLSGARLDYWAVPSMNVKGFSDFYYSQTLSLCTYYRIWKKDLLILAQKLTIGTIFSERLDAVPVPKRFFGGSEENLRGYRYYTVSPLTKHDKPIGGRSAVFYTIEPRFRLTECFGLVPFFDIGNVYSNQLPSFGGKWRKSVGIGLRYFSFIGPLRLDVAFPLDRREELDPHWWVFVSLGQSF